MNRFTTAVLLVISAVGVASAQPKLEILQNKFDFGVAPQTSTLVQEFWFKSTGTDTVVFSKVTTGCDCATVELKQMFIGPGDSLLVPFYWQTQHKIGQSGRYPYFFSNIGPDPSRVSLTASVLPSLDTTYPISFKPYKVELSRLPNMSVDSVVISITNRDSLDYTIVSVASPSDYCDVTLPESIKSGETIQALVRLKPGFDTKGFERSMTMSFTAYDGRTVRYSLPIRRRLIGVPEGSGS